MKKTVVRQAIVLLFILFTVSCSIESPTEGEDTPRQAPTVESRDLPTSLPTSSPTIEVEASPTPEPTSIPQEAEEPPRILFIGSSHIFHGPTGHDLPRMFSGMALAGGHRSKVDRSSESGVWLIDHLDNEETMGMLNDESWDYVVLQEDMYMGSREDGQQESMFPAIRALAEEASEAGAETILFNTWVNPAPIREGLLSQYQDDQERLSKGYTEIASELNLRVARVDEAVLKSLQERPDLYLWSEADEHGHANFLGSYLAAAVFYALIFEESPVGLEFIYVDEETSNYLQTIAAETVFGQSN